MIRPRPAAGVVVAFTLGRIWFCAVGCSWPVVAPLGQAQRKRKICRNTVVKSDDPVACSKRNYTLRNFALSPYFLLPSPPAAGGEGLGVRGPRCSIRSSIAVSIKHRTLAGSCVT